MTDLGIGDKENCTIKEKGSFTERQKNSLVKICMHREISSGAY